MPNYSCEKCGKKFYQKNDYTKHMNRKLACNGTNVSEKLINLEKKIEQIEQKIDHVPVEENSKIENSNIDNNTNKMGVLENFCEENNIKFKMPKTEFQELCDKLKIKYTKKDTKITLMEILDKYFTENPDKLTVEFLLENGLEKNIKKTKKKKETAIEPTEEEKEESEDKSYLREPCNEIIFKMEPSDLESESLNKKNSDIIISVVKKCHNILYKSLNMPAGACRNDIITLILLKLLEPLMSDKPEEGKIDLLNKEYYNYTLQDIQS